MVGHRKGNRAGREAGTGLALLLALTLAGPGQAQNAGPDSLVESYGNWLVRCGPEAGRSGDEALGTVETRACEASQELFQAEVGQRLVAVLLRREGDATNVTIIAPFGLLLSEGITLAADDEDLQRIGFRTCLPSGCFARADLDADTVAALLTAQSVTLTMAAVPDGDPVIIPLLVDGLAEAWAGLIR